MSRDQEDVVVGIDSANNGYAQEVIGNKSDTVGGNSLVALTKINKAAIDTIDGMQDVPSQDSADNVVARDVIGNKTDTVGGNSLVALNKINKAAIDVIDAFHDVPSADAADNVVVSDVVGNKTDTVAGTSLKADHLKTREILDNGRSVWYCDSSVGASGAGTQWATAFKTITEAIAAASAGDVIYLRGEFLATTEGATINLNKELWLIGENTTPNQGCTMIYNGGADAYPLLTVSAHQCKIFNIYFSGIATQHDIVVGAYWKTHIKGCKFDQGQEMISIAGDSPDTTIEDCLFRSWTDYAIDYYCTRLMVKNCRFIDVGSAKTAIRTASNGGDRPDSAIIGCKFHTYDNTNGVAIEVTNTPTVGYMYIDDCHFSYYADDNHAVSKRTGYCGMNWRDAAALPVT